MSGKLLILVGREVSNVFLNFIVLFLIVIRFLMMFRLSPLSWFDLDLYMVFIYSFICLKKF